MANPILPLWEYIPDGVYRARVKNVTGRHALYLVAELNKPYNEWMSNLFDGRSICDVEEFVFMK